MPALHLPAKMFQQPLFACLDEHHPGGQNQRAGLQQRQQQDSFLEKPVKPRFRNLEAELVIHRLGGGRDQAFRLAQKAHQPAFIHWPFDFTAHSRSIHLQHQIDQ